MAVKPIVGVRPDPNPTYESNGRRSSMAVDLNELDELDTSDESAD